MNVKKIESKIGIKAYSLDEVIKNANKSKKFEIEYEQEIARMRLAKQIREVRLEKKLTQKAVAAKAGMPQSVIARVESGNYGISLDSLERIANVFGKRIQLG